MPTTLLPSILRTWVPLAVGWLLALPLTGPVVAFLGISTEQATAAVTSAVTAVITGLYYLLARLVEVYVAPRLGGILVGLRPGVAPAAYTGKHVADPAGARLQDLDAAGGDGGWSRAGFVVVLAACALALAVVPASASHWQPQTRPTHAAGAVVAPRVSRTWVCDGVLVVRWDAIRLGGHRTWEPLLDDGTAGLEVHDSAGRYGPGGRWVGVVTASGGEHVLRWAGYQQAVAEGAQIDLVRVVEDGYRSVGYPAAEPCA